METVLETTGETEGAGQVPPRFLWCEKTEKQEPVAVECEACEEKCDVYKEQVLGGQVTGREEQAIELDDRLSELKNAVYDAYYEMGVALREIRNREFYRDLGYGSLDEYAEKKHGFKYRKAAYLIAIVENCEAAGIAKEDVRGIDWTKMKELPQLTDENRAEWLQKARDLSVQDLKAAVKESKGEDPSPEKVYMGFSFDPSQKEVIDRALDVAGKLTGSDVKSYLLQVMAEEFLATYETMDEAATSRFQNVHGEGGDE